MIEKKLAKLGFSDEEAKIYLTCLEVGSSPADRISEKSGLDRVNTYLTIDSLMNKGMMSSYNEENISYYLAENPDRVLERLREKQQEVNKKIKSFENFLPELVSIVNSKNNKPKVKFFEGKEGLMAVQNDFIETLNKGDTIYIFLPYDDFYASDLRKKVRSGTKIRVNKNIKVKVIYTSKKGRQYEYEKKEKKHLKEIKFIEYKKYPIKGGLNIYGNNIFMIDYSGKPSGIVIQNKSIASMLTCLFRLAWDCAQ